MSAENKTLPENPPGYSQQYGGTYNAPSVAYAQPYQQNQYQQPVGVTLVAAQPPSTWTTGLMNCEGCCYPCCCMYCSICELRDRVDPTIPFAFEFTLCPLRDRVRQMYNIDGSSDCDFCDVWCAAPCVVAQMNRELNARGAPPTATVVTTQPMAPQFPQQPQK